ncbi:hypothetical protein ACIP29_33965 [Streptomyces coelicoflavus]
MYAVGDHLHRTVDLLAIDDRNSDGTDGTATGTGPVFFGMLTLDGAGSV